MPKALPQNPFPKVFQAFQPQIENQKPRAELGSIAQRVVLDFEASQKGRTIVLGGTPTVVEWEKCRHLRVSGGRHNCTRFFTGCAKEKCPPKFFEPRE